MRQYKPRVRLLPYKASSRSARDVARGAGLLRVNVNGTRFVPRDGDFIVNWGNHGPLPGRFWMGTVRYVNPPHVVALARDKRDALVAMAAEGVPTVEFTTNLDEAEEWFRDEHVVVQRNTATGQGGAGIVVCDPTLTDNVPDSDGVLWTKYFKRKQEFRIHVWGNDVLDIQEKKKRRGVDVDYRIRSYDNGWVFCRENVCCPEAVSQAAVAAVRALGLDFGAVDVGWNEKYQQAAVFEVNTAPGVEGTTLEKYVAKIRELVA